MTTTERRAIQAEQRRRQRHGETWEEHEARGKYWLEEQGHRRWATCDHVRACDEARLLAYDIVAQWSGIPVREEEIEDAVQEHFFAQGIVLSLAYAGLVTREVRRVVRGELGYETGRQRGR